MSDIHELREKLRSDQGPAPSGGGWFGLLVLVVAACGITFGAVYFLPRILSLQPASFISPLPPSSSIPSFKPVGEGGTAADMPAPASPARSGSNIVVRYEGKSAAEVGKAADEVCFRRAHARYPHWSKTPRMTTKEVSDFTVDSLDHFNELMHCLLTEGTQRYCSASQRRMIEAETVMYFRGIEHGNRILKRALDEALDRVPAQGGQRLQREFAADPSYIKALEAGVAVDQSVVAAIEYRLRDGLLTKANRDDIAAAAPPAIRERLMRVEPPKSKCPEQPWWAFWRSA